MLRKMRLLAFPTVLFCALHSAAHESAPQSASINALPSLAPMLDVVTPAVVNIATKGPSKAQNSPLLNDPFFRRFFNFPRSYDRPTTQSLGSGVIVDSINGLIMTNHHVIANAEEIRVNLSDGRDFEAELIGSDPQTDIAVLSIPSENLTSLEQADSDKLRVGDYVVAIGNPFGLGQTVTSGIVSALARSGLGIAGYEDLIQTDASINPGNSGGALVNLKGQLVGINTAIYSKSGGNIGIGFAIPVNMAARVAEQLVEFGAIERGYFGAEFQDLDPTLSRAFGVPLMEGAIVVSIFEGSPAQQAGLRLGDIVTKIDDREISGAKDLKNQIELRRAGSFVLLHYLREGQLRDAKIVVSGSETRATLTDTNNVRLAGIMVGRIPEHSQYFGKVQGVMLYGISKTSVAWKVGLRKGDIVSSVNQNRVPSVEAFLKIVNQSKGRLLLGVHRNGGVAFVVIP